MFRQLHVFAAGADLRLAGLLFFFLVFVAVLVQLFVVRRRADFVPLAHLPLCADQPPAAPESRPS